LEQSNRAQTKRTAVSLKFRMLRAICRQNWIRTGLRYRLLRKFAHWSELRDIPFECDFYGHRYAGELSRHIDWHVYFFGAYELSELQLLSRIAAERGGGILLDIGGNVGQHSLYLSNHFEQVHSFEPFEAVRKKFEQRLSMNRVKNVKVHPVGIGQENTLLKFHVPPEANQGLGSFVPPDNVDPEELNQLQSLPVVHGDRYMKEQGISSVSAVKIDIEGFERSAIKGLRQTLAEHRPFVVMEFGPETQASFQGSNEFFDMLPSNYSVHTVKDPSKSGMPIGGPGFGLGEFDFFAPGGNLLLAPAEGLQSIQSSKQRAA
jgi:FkbM family methyltransferase